MRHDAKIASRSAHRARWRAACVVGALCALLSSAVHTGVHAAQPHSFKVIVHPSNPMSAIEKDALRRIFLKQVVHWRHGESIKPVDLGFRSEVRSDFSREVMARSVQAVRSYWLQRVFSGGNVPPIELQNDAAVIRFVAQNRGAVGYVGAGVDVTDVKAIALQ